MLRVIKKKKSVLNQLNQNNNSKTNVLGIKQASGMVGSRKLKVTRSGLSASLGC